MKKQKTEPDFYWMKTPDADEPDKGFTPASRLGFYNNRFWKMRVKQKLELNPVCEHCYGNGIIKTAQVVDHITPVPPNCTSMRQFVLCSNVSNLQSLCEKCHVLKTRADQYGKPFLSRAQMRANAKKFEE